MFRRGGRMTPSLRRALIVMPFWAISVIWMWSWWLTSGEDHFLALFIPLTLALFYEFAVLPSIFLYFVIKAKTPSKKIAPKEKKVAVISLCVPSLESIDIVENQLRAMSEITYPHDSWILDEGNDPEIKKLARKYGVNHFSRKGIRKYNQPAPPFQKKTKAGNVNAWLNHVKRRKYDFFVQLDIDHLPKPNYLHKTLGYFKDPNIAWVQAPSVYSNLNSWTARGAAEQELVLQGPLQMGFYGHSETPFIIGSHCTYRMSAIREIGGFQPTRAEDHLDTVYLSHSGYKGVFLPEIIAEGDGPETLNTYLAQQYAWAYSMFQVLLGHTPKLLKAMPWRRRWQFLFAQTWYPMWSLSYLIMFMSPVLALWFGRDIVSVEPGGMLLHFLPTFIGGFIIWWVARPIMQPRKLHLSWRGIILHAVRWPVILRALTAALFKIKKPYMITPKGKFAKMAPSIKTYQPFLFLGGLSALTVLFAMTFGEDSIPHAQALFASINAIFMLTICAVDISLRFRQSRPAMPEFKLYWLKPVGATAALAATIVLSGITSLYSISNPLVFAESNTISSKVAAVQPVNYYMTTQEIVKQIELTPAKDKGHPTLGMYNDTLDLPLTKRPYIQHIFVDWRDDHYFAFAIAKAVQAGNTPLITIEPRGEKNGAVLLEDIRSGKQDKQLDKLRAALRVSKNPVYIRFAHEMELAKLYPWGNQDSGLFIEAYRHVMTRLKAGNAQNVLSVWSPAGNMGAEAYYPGDAFVDIIGTTILYDQYWYGDRLPSFADVAKSRQWLQILNKPIWVVEFGAGHANPHNQKILIEDAMSHYGSYGYDSLVYLNLIDANIKGPDYRLDSINDFGSFFSDYPLAILENSTSEAIACLKNTSGQIPDGLFIRISQKTVWSE